MAKKSLQEQADLAASQWLDSLPEEQSDELGYFDEELQGDSEVLYGHDLDLSKEDINASALETDYEIQQREDAEEQVATGLSPEDELEASGIYGDAPTVLDVVLPYVVEEEEKPEPTKRWRKKDSYQEIKDAYAKANAPVIPQVQTPFQVIKTSEDIAFEYHMPKEGKESITIIGEDGSSLTRFIPTEVNPLDMKVAGTGVNTLGSIYAEEVEKELEPFDQLLYNTLLQKANKTERDKEQIVELRASLVSEIGVGHEAWKVATGRIDLEISDDPGGMSQASFFLQTIDKASFGIQANIKEILLTESLGDIYLGDVIDTFETKIDITAKELGEQIKIPEGVTGSTVEADVRRSISAISKGFDRAQIKGPGGFLAGTGGSRAFQQARKEREDKAYEIVRFIAEKMVPSTLEVSNPDLYASQVKYIETQVIKQWTEVDQAAVHARDPITALPLYYGEDAGELAGEPIMRTMVAPVPSDFNLPGLIKNASIAGKGGSPYTRAQYDMSLPDVREMVNGVFPEEYMRQHEFYQKSIPHRLQDAISERNVYVPEGMDKQEGNEYFRHLTEEFKFARTTLQEQKVKQADEANRNKRTVVGRAYDETYDLATMYRGEAAELDLERDANDLSDTPLARGKADIVPFDREIYAPSFDENFIGPIPMTEYSFGLTSHEDMSHVAMLSGQGKQVVYGTGEDAQLVTLGAGELSSHIPTEQFELISRNVSAQKTAQLEAKKDLDRTVKGSDRTGLYSEKGMSQTDIFTEARFDRFSKEEAFDIATNPGDAYEPEITYEDNDRGRYLEAVALGTRDHYELDDHGKKIKTQSRYLYEDRTPEWYIQRYGKVTASSANKMGTPNQRYNAAVRMASDELGIEKPPFMSNDAIRQGTEFESKVKKTLEADGLFVEEAYFTENPDLPGFGVSPDGIVFDAAGNLVGLAEFKIHQSTKAFEEGEKTYMDQLQLQMLVTGADRVYFYRMNAETKEVKKSIVMEDATIQQRILQEGLVTLGIKSELLSDEGIVAGLRDMASGRREERLLLDFKARRLKAHDLEGEVMGPRSEEWYIRDASIKKEAEDDAKAEVFDMKQAKDKKMMSYTSEVAYASALESQGHSEGLRGSVKAEMVKRAKEVRRNEEAKDFAIKQAGLSVDTRAMSPEKASYAKSKVIADDPKATKAFEQRKKELDLGEKELQGKKDAIALEKKRKQNAQATERAINQSVKAVKFFTKSLYKGAMAFGNLADEVLHQGMDDIQLGREYGIDPRQSRGWRELFSTTGGLDQKEATMALGESGSMMDRLAGNPQLYGQMIAELGIAGLAGAMPGLNDVVKQHDVLEFSAMMLEKSKTLSEAEGAQFLRKFGLNRIASSDRQNLTGGMIRNVDADINVPGAVKTHLYAEEAYNRDTRETEQLIQSERAAKAAGLLIYGKRHPKLASAAVGQRVVKGEVVEGGPLDVASDMVSDAAVVVDNFTDGSILREAAKATIELLEVTKTSIEMDQLRRYPTEFFNKNPGRYRELEDIYGDLEPGAFRARFSDDFKTENPEDLNTRLSPTESETQLFGGNMINRYFDKGRSRYTREGMSDPKWLNLGPSSQITNTYKVDYSAVLRGKLDVFVRTDPGVEAEAPKSIPLTTEFSDRSGTGDGEYMNGY